MSYEAEPRRWDDPASRADTPDRYGKGVRRGLGMAIEAVEGRLALSRTAEDPHQVRFGLKLAVEAIRVRLAAAEAEELHPTEDLSKLTEHGGLAADDDFAGEVT